MAKIAVNRAPFLTLWASVVAQRLGYSKEEALTLGRAVAGLTAQSKGRRLGIYTQSTDAERKKVQGQREAIGAETVEMMERVVPCVWTPDGLRALSKASPTDPDAVRKYLAAKFKEALPMVEEKLAALASTFEPSELDAQAMDIYMHLRPNVPTRREGWGKAGILDTSRIDTLISKRAGL